MEVIDCFVCFSTFTDHLVPKTLECGHSLCCPCITTLIKGKSECPKCRRKMTMQDVTQYSTNYDLLNLINYVSKLQLRKDHFRLRMVNLTNKFEDKLNSLANEENLLGERLHSLAKEESAVTGRMKTVTEENDFVKDGIHQLEEFDRLDWENGNLEKSKQTLDKLEKEFREIPPISVNYEAPYIALFKEMIRMEDFKSQIEFLYLVYGRVQNGEKVFAVYFVTEEMKYGRISTQGNKILIHSLAMKPNEKEEHITAVKFSDLKKCFISLKASPFLTICCNERGLQQTVFIETNDHPFVPQFLKLCSGEFGCSYRGTSYRDSDVDDKFKGILEVPNYMRNGVAEDGQIDYIASVQLTTECEVGDVVVCAGKRGSFCLYEMIQLDAESDVIGNVILPCNLQEVISFKDENFNKVVDCGLSLALI